MHLCALLPTAVLPVPARAEGDPLEGLNRQVHEANLVLQRHVLGPAAEAYERMVPDAVRQGVRNALSNLREPITVVAGLAAGEVALASNAARRFAINSTLGVGGVRDAAAERGYRRRGFELADAACSWGVPRGPYLVLPVLGPSTLRDALAALATSAALARLAGTEGSGAWQAGEAFVGYATVHREVVRLLDASLDGYATLRSVHLQQRALACAADRDAPEASAATDAAGP